MKQTNYWIKRERQGRKVTGYIVTDGIWTSATYKTLADAKKRLQQALWGEGVNTI